MHDKCYENWLMDSEVIMRHTQTDRQMPDSQVKTENSLHCDNKTQLKEHS